MIIRAAVKVNGNIYTGRRHVYAIHAAVKAGQPTPITQQMQGFITNDGIFLDRVNARIHAVQNKQIEFDETRVGKPLISEELW